ncbi:hypothetical protein Poly21_38810 [Allorhodopirellula heiligendammensis]|uniref:Uncharacterized protein n=1 Tax=Allorhodopirellula heiligendammensis TaxID=2714739 RepID=A0A5C6BZL0_9BACT|nr:hypothetical protein Poly21_38810 [Allorhodopirellula heiligendammensis]
MWKQVGTRGEIPLPRQVAGILLIINRKRLGIENEPASCDGGRGCRPLGICETASKLLNWPAPQTFGETDDDPLHPY